MTITKTVDNLTLTFIMRTVDSNMWSCGPYRLYESRSDGRWMIADDSGWYDGEFDTPQEAIKSTGNKEGVSDVA